MVAYPGSARTARSARRLNAHRLNERRLDERRLDARRLNTPRPALVEAAAGGAPRRVNRQGVVVVREEWHVVDRWWTEQPIARRYFDLVLETGENAVVYHDGEAGSWFSQRA